MHAIFKIEQKYTSLHYIEKLYIQRKSVSIMQVPWTVSTQN